MEKIIRVRWFTLIPYIITNILDGSRGWSYRAIIFATRCGKYGIPTRFHYPQTARDMIERQIADVAVDEINQSDNTNDRSYNHHS